MIHFDFVVTDEEASTIMEGVQDQVVDCITKILLVEGGENAAAVKAWLQRRVEYLKALQNKMSNTRVHHEAGDVQSSSLTLVN